MTDRSSPFRKPAENGAANRLHEPQQHQPEQGSEIQQRDGHGLRMGSAARRRHGGGCDALVEQVARALGVRAWRASELMWGTRSVTEQAAVILGVMKRAGAHEAAVHFLQPLDAAIADCAPEGLSPQLFLEEQTADGQEDVAEVALLAHRSPETLRAYLKAVERNQAALQRMQAALAAELDRR